MLDKEIYYREDTTYQKCHKSQIFPRRESNEQNEVNRIGVFVGYRGLADNRSQGYGGGPNQHQHPN